MAKKIGTLGGNFLEGSSTSDRIYGDSGGLISSRTMGRDQIHSYNGADFLTATPRL